MMRILILLSALLIFATGSQALAQETKQTQATNETERPQTEVDRLINIAKERGEIVLARCLQDCDENAVEGDVEAGRALELPKPAYPAIARAAHVSGTVKVQLLIDIDGTVIGAVAVSGHPLLQAASVQAAKDALFSPTKVDGKAVKVTGVVTYNFVSQ